MDSNNNHSGSGNGSNNNYLQYGLNFAKNNQELVKKSGQYVGKVAYDNKEAIGNYAYQNREAMGNYAYQHKDEIAKTAYQNQDFLMDVGKGYQQNQQQQQKPANPYGGYAGAGNSAGSGSYNQQNYPNLDQPQEQNYQYSQSSNANGSGDKAVSYKYKEDYFVMLRKAPENEYCFDCGKQNPECVSILNAVFICGNCQDIHLQIIPSIYSGVMSIDLDSWSQNLLQKLWNGGNRKLREFLNGYSLPDSNGDGYGAGTDYSKYSTVACDYYRRWIAAQASGQNFTESAPDYTYGRQMIGAQQLAGQWQDHGEQKQNYGQEQQPLNAEVQQKDTEKTKWDYAWQAAGAMKTGVCVMAAGAVAAKKKADETGVTKACIDAKDYTFQKAEEYKVKDKTIAAGKYVAAKAEEHQVKEKTIAAGKYAANKAEEHKLKEKTIAAGNYAADKAEEYKLKEKAMVAGEHALDAGKKTGTFLHQEGTAAHQQYESGNLADHSKAKAKEAGSFLKATGKGMFAKAKNFYNKSNEDQSQQSPTQTGSDNQNPYQSQNQNPYQSNNNWQ